MVTRKPGTRNLTGRGRELRRSGVVDFRMVMSVERRTVLTPTLTLSRACDNDPTLSECDVVSRSQKECRQKRGALSLKSRAIGTCDE